MYNVHTHTHTYIHAYVHTCIHAYTHTHTRTRPPPPTHTHTQADETEQGLEARKKALEKELQEVREKLAQQQQLAQAAAAGRPGPLPSERSNGVHFNGVEEKVQQSPVTLSEEKQRSNGVHFNGVEKKVQPTPVKLFREIQRPQETVQDPPIKQSREKQGLEEKVQPSPVKRFFEEALQSSSSIATSSGTWACVWYSCLQAFVFTGLEELRARRKGSESICMQRTVLGACAI